MTADESRFEMARYDELCQKFEAKQAQISEYEAALKEFEAKPAEMQEIMRKNGLVIDNLKDRWQKLAFTFYSELVQIASRSKQLLEDDA